MRNHSDATRRGIATFDSQCHLGEVTLGPHSATSSGGPQAEGAAHPGPEFPRHEGFRKHHNSLSRTAWVKSTVQQPRRAGRKSVTTADRGRSRSAQSDRTRRAGNRASSRTPFSTPSPRKTAVEQAVCPWTGVTPQRFPPAFRTAKPQVSGLWARHSCATRMASQLTKHLVDGTIYACGAGGNRTPEGIRGRAWSERCVPA